MAENPQQPKPPLELIDAMTVFPAGMDSGISPELIPKNQLAFASNVTVRGSYVTHRPPFTDVALQFVSPSDQTAFETGLWQGGCWAQPPNSPEGLVCSISGNIWFIEISGSTGIVSLITPIFTDLAYTVPGPSNPPANPQAWLWQAEKWVIINDGASDPIFLDLSTMKARRSQVQSRVTNNATINANFVIPTIGVNVTVTFSAATGLLNGQLVNVWGVGQFTVFDNTLDPIVILTNVNGLPVGDTVVAPGTVTWTTGTSELPPGRMGAYWRGRIWESLTDGIQFLAGDIVGGPSGTLAENFVDAILKITENTYLAGGGNFRIPGNIDHIQAMVPLPVLDASMGQGQLAILTSTTVFTVNASVDRLTWQTMQNPILTEGLLSNGGLGQYSTVQANGDIIFRAVDGIRSYVLGRREFDTWGNVPISQEMARVLDLDAIDLLPFSSAVIFDNRLLMTTAPNATAQGVFWAGLVALNFDPLSTLRGKLPSVYDGLWKGMNTLQLVTGFFGRKQRAFSFVMNANQNAIKLTEILETPSDIQTPNFIITTPDIYDNGVEPITLEFETSYFFRPQDRRVQPYLQLMDGEIAVDILVGTVKFRAYWKPDQYPCWIPWVSWSECAELGDNSRPQFRPRMGFGRPPVSFCDPSTNRPLVEGYEFQVKMIITGHCRVRAIRCRAVVKPEPKFSAPACDAICPPNLL